jgi:hypothetical protein
VDESFDKRAGTAGGFHYEYLAEHISSSSAAAAALIFVFGWLSAADPPPPLLSFPNLVSHSGASFFVLCMHGIVFILYYISFPLMVC